MNLGTPILLSLFFLHLLPTCVFLGNLEKGIRGLKSISTRPFSFRILEGRFPINASHLLRLLRSELLARELDCGFAAFLRGGLSIFSSAWLAFGFLVYRFLGALLYSGLVFISRNRRGVLLLRGSKGGRDRDGMGFH